MKMLKWIHLFAGILFASNLLAAEPVAVWNGDLADNSTKNDITLTLNGNSVTDGMVTIDQAKGIQFYNNNYNSKIVTVIVKYSNLDITSTTSRSLITVGGGTNKTTTGTNDDGVGIYVLDGATVKGLKNGAAGTTGSSSNSISSSGVIALTYNGNSGGGGTNGYLGNGTSVYKGGTLKITALYTRFIGVGGNYAVTGKLASAMGMKVEGVAIFDTALSATDIEAYEFPNPGPGPGPEPGPEYEPVAVWNGDFDVTEKDGYTLDLNGNVVQQDGSVVIESSPIKIQLNGNTGFTDFKGTYIVKYSSVTANPLTDTALITLNTGTGTKQNLVGLVTENTGAIKGIWQNVKWNSPDNVSKGNLAINDGSHTFALRAKMTDTSDSENRGTYGYIDGVEVFGVSGLVGKNEIHKYIVIGGADTESLLPLFSGMKIEAVAIFNSILTAEEIANYKFPTSGAKPVLFNFSQDAPEVDGWINHRQNGGSNITTEMSEGIQFTATGNGNFYNQGEPTVDFGEGGYTDINGKSHTTVAEEVKVSLGLPATTPFDTSVYFTGLMNGAASGHTATISGLDSSAKYVIYVGFGRNKENGAQKAGFTIAESGYGSVDALEYVVSQDGNNTLVAQNYQTFTAGSGLTAGGSGVLIVRLNGVTPTDEGKVVFTLSGDRAGINFLAIKELQGGSTPETTIKLGAVKVSDINNAPEFSKCGEDDTVIVNLVGTKTLTFDTELKFGKAKVYLDGVLTLLGNGFSAPDPYEISKFNFSGVSSIDYSWIEIGSGMAINFNSNERSLENSDEAGIQGLTIYGNCWNNCDGISGNIGAKMFAPNGSDIISDTMPISWSCSNVYQWDGATTPYLKGYLDDTGNALTISATVPFACYDLYIVCATDTENSTFSPKTVNGIKYTTKAGDNGIASKGSDGWGQSRGLTPILGTNVMRIMGLTNNKLMIAAPRENGRGGIAAIVVVKVTPAKIVDVECGDGKLMSEINAIDADSVNLHFNAGGVLTVDVAPNKPCNIVDSGAFTLDDTINGAITADDWGKFDFTKATGEITIKADVAKGVTSSALVSLIQAANNNYTFIFKSSGENPGVALDFGQPVETIKCHIVFDGGTHAMTYLNQNKNCLFGLNGTGDKPTLLVTNGATLNFTAKDISWYSGVVDVNGVIRVNDGATLNFLQSEATTFFYRQRLWLDPGSTMTFNYGITHYDSGDESDFRWQGGTTNGMEQIYVPASDTDMMDKPAIIRQLGDGDLHLASDETRGLAIFVGENSKLQLDTEFSRAEDAATIKTGGGILEFKRDVTAPITIYGGGIGFASECSTSDLIFESDNTLIEVAAGITVSPNITRNGHSIVKLGAGALKLDAGYEGELTLREGVLKLKLSAAQVATGYTAAGVTFGEGITGITFVLPDGTEIPTEGKTYEGGGLLWTGEAGDKLWKTPGNWSTGTVPTADDAVAISFATEIIVEADDTCKMLSIQNDVSLSGSFDNLGMVAIDPEKTLTITVAASEEKIFPSVTGAGSLVKAGDGVLVVANVPEGPMEIASGKLIVTANTPATISAVISGEGCFEKRGPEALTLTAENTLTGGLIVGEGVLKMGAGKCLGPYYTEEVGYATIIVKEGAALDTNGQTNGGSLARTYAVQFEANAILTDTGTRTNDLKFFPLSKIIALGDMFIDVDEEKNVGISLHYNSDGVELDLGEHTVTKRGEGEFVLGSGAPIIGTGKLLIQEGTLTTQPKNGGATSVAEDGTIEFADGTVFNPTSYSGANGDITAANIIYNGIIFGETGTLTATKKLSGKGIANNVVVGDGATIDATGEGEFLVSSVRFGSALTVISETGADLFMVGGAKPVLPTSLTVLLPDGSPNRGSFSLQYVDSKVVLACTVIAFELPIIENASFKVEGGEIVDKHYARVEIGGNATISYTTIAGYSFYDEMGTYTGKSLIKFVFESLERDPRITELLKDVTTRQAVVSIRSGDETEYYFDFMEAFDLLQENDELILYDDAILTLTDPYEVLADTVITLNGFELRGSEAVSFLIDGGIAFYLYEQYVFNPADKGTVNDNITFTLTDGIIYSYAKLNIASDSYIKIYSPINGYTYAPTTMLSTITEDLRAGKVVELPYDNVPELCERAAAMGYELVEKVSTMSIDASSQLAEYLVVISPDEAVNGSKIESFEIANGKATITIPAKSNLYYGLEYANNPVFSGSQVKWAEQGAKTLSAEAEGANMFYRVVITDKYPNIE